MTSYNVQHFSYIWDYIIGFPVAQEYKRIHALFLLQGFMTNKFNIPGRLNFFGAKVRKSAYNCLRERGFGYYANRARHLRE